MIYVIIAPMLSGKTTLMHHWAQAAQMVETDVVEKTSLSTTQDELKALRIAAYESGDWAPYNEVWHSMLRKWSEALRSGTIVLAHSLADASVVGQPMCYVLIPLGEFKRRQSQVTGRRCALAALNRQTVTADMQVDNLPVYEDLQQALLSVVIARHEFELDRAL